MLSSSVSYLNQESISMSIKAFFESQPGRILYWLGMIASCIILANFIITKLIPFLRDLPQ